MTRPATIALIGAGSRGADVYAEHVLRFPSLARIVAVAEPDPVRRQHTAARHAVPASQRFSSWEELFAQGRLADAVIIATPDAHHVGPAAAALAQGYQILLEKPIAPDLTGVLELARAARTSAGRVTVAHVLRHSPFFTTLKRLLAEGRIGQLVTIQHTENIGYWHFAHSFVRGNWRQEATSSPLILAKACHDLDLLRWLVDRPCARVASHGRLSHFHLGNAPAGSTDRCTGGCAVERTCPYSAIRIYLEAFAGEQGWPNSVLTPDPNYQSVLRALETGPYGRCVYRCDNDVVDHQTVSLEFEGGVTATMTVSAFTQEVTRTIHVMGTHGEIHGHMGKGELLVNDYRQGATDIVRLPVTGEGHGQADQELIRDFIDRLRRDATSPALTDLEASIDSHLMAFAAERARKDGSGVEVQPLRYG